MTATTTSGDHAFPAGTFYDMMPIEPVDANCVALDAGPLRFVVESRHLNSEIARAALPADKLPAEDTRPGFADRGASLHVFGAADGLEHLRFDCFENDPHYHYVMHSAGGQLVCPMDPVADGDATVYTLGRLRQRLPEMLEFAGATELAQCVRADAGTTREIASILDRVADLLAQAG